MPDPKEDLRAGSQAQDIAQQHPPPPFGVEGVCAVAQPLWSVQDPEAFAHRLPDLRHIRQAPGARRLICA